MLKSPSLPMATPLLWAKMADTVDYGQYKTGIRITGLVYSSIVFFIKLGLALGGALAGWLVFPETGIDRDFMVLSLPQFAHADVAMPEWMPKP